MSNSLTNYGRRHFKLFTNCHVSWDTLYENIFGFDVNFLCLRYLKNDSCSFKQVSKKYGKLFHLNFLFSILSQLPNIIQRQVQKKIHAGNSEVSFSDLICFLNVSYVKCSRCFECLHVTETHSGKIVV